MADVQFQILNGDEIEPTILASKRNLLINPWFTNTSRVNQRGVSGEVSTPGYFIDCWKLVSGTVTLTDNGLEVDGEIEQILEVAAGTDVTASVQMHSGTATASYDNSTKTFTITSSGGVIQAAKLEKGTISTLAYDPPADYGEELHKCQRYNIPITANSWIYGVSTTAGFTINAFMPTPAELRTTPSIYGPAAAATNWTIKVGGSIVTPTAISVISKAPGGVRIDFTVNPAVSSNSVAICYCLAASTNSGLSAEI